MNPIPGMAPPAPEWTKAAEAARNRNASGGSDGHALTREAMNAAVRMGERRVRPVHVEMAYAIVYAGRMTIPYER